jgi:hypothetical protein
MKNKIFRIIPGLAAPIAFLALPASAQITGDLSTTSVSYGNPLAVQTVNTSFGASTGASGGDDYDGSELDAAYGTVGGGNLYLFLTGDVQGGTSQNSLQIFLGGGGSTIGQSTLNTSIAPLSNMNGSTFGFNATLGLTFNDYNGTLYTDAANLQSGGGGGGYVGADALTGGIGYAAISGSGYSFQVAFNNTLVSTMNGLAAGTAYSGGASATTGLELAIPLADLGTISGNIDVLADIDNGGLSYLSNQFLPGMPTGTGSLGTATFDDPNYFVVPVPEPSTLALLGMSGLCSFFAFRR